MQGNDSATRLNDAEFDLRTRGPSIAHAQPSASRRGQGEPARRPNTRPMQRNNSKHILNGEPCVRMVQSHGLSLRQINQQASQQVNQQLGLPWADKSADAGLAWVGAGLGGGGLPGEPTSQPTLRLTCSRACGRPDKSVGDVTDLVQARSSQRPSQLTCALTWVRLRWSLVRASVKSVDNSSNRMQRGGGLARCPTAARRSIYKIQPLSLKEDSRNAAVADSHSQGVGRTEPTHLRRVANSHHEEVGPAVPTRLRRATWHNSTPTFARIPLTHAPTVNA